MKHQVTLSLKTIYDGAPAVIETIVNKKSIYKDKLEKNITLNFDYDCDDQFKIEINKTGKNIDAVKNGNRQEITVEQLLLNGFNLHPDKFGIFYIKDNPYVNDSKIQTDQLNLNGTWTINVPLFPLKGVSTLESYRKFRDPIADTSIACFGCSVTYGAFLEYNESWPAQLSNIAGKDIKNYGISGSNNQEIIANACEFAKNYQVKDIIILLCQFCRLQLVKDDQLYNWHPGSDNKFYKMFPTHIEKMVMYSETDLLFAGQVPYFLKKIKEIKSNITGNIFVSTYIKDHYECLEKIDNTDFILLPFYEMSKEYKLAADNLHPGPEHNRLFAKSIVNYTK
jgi:hypothetical protein